MCFGIITPEMLAAYWAAHGITPPPETPPEPAEPIVCEVCETELDDPFVEIEGPAPAFFKRSFHVVCLNMHLIRNENNPDDELSAYITRKIPCSTAP